MITTAVVKAGNSNGLMNVMKGLQTFSGRDPAQFDEWHKNTCIFRSIFRRGVFNITRGQTRPAIAHGDENVSSTLLQIAYNRHNK